MMHARLVAVGVLNGRMAVQVLVDEVRLDEQRFVVEDLVRRPVREDRRSSPMTTTRSAMIGTISSSWVAVTTVFPAARAAGSG